MGFLDSLGPPKWHWDKVKAAASKTVYSRMRRFALSRLGLPDEVMAQHGDDQRLQADLRNVIVIYYSSCIVFLDEFFFVTRDIDHTEYDKRIKSLSPQGVIDLAFAYASHYVFAYGNWEETHKNSAGFLMYATAFAYDKPIEYLTPWLYITTTTADPTPVLNQELLKNFSSVLGLHKLSQPEMIDLCRLADSLAGYVANLYAKSGDLDSFVDLLMESELGR
jgi:hypothetical protein